jgi:hypothetical protein
MQTEGWQDTPYGILVTKKHQIQDGTKYVAKDFKPNQHVTFIVTHAY